MFTVIWIVGIALAVIGWVVAFLVDKPIVIRVRFIFPGVAAFCLFPLIITKHDFENIHHETTHWFQQSGWMRAGYVGLAIWLILYFMVLPVIWNPFRRKWETEAYEGDGLHKAEIDKVLKRWPYMLLF